MAEPELVRDPMPDPGWPAGIPRPALSARGALATFTTQLEPAFRHGPWSMGEIVRRSTQELSQLAGRREGVALQWSGARFLDLEAGSHPRGGSCVTVAGIGRFQGDGSDGSEGSGGASGADAGFEIHQYAATSPDGERALLEAVARELAGATDLVTFAGKSFDAPLLAERARAEGVELTLPRRHFDLYRMSTKLLRRRFADSRLVTLERELLRYERVGDLPGASMPWVWRTAAAEGSEPGADALLWAVVSHNLLDVLALPALAAELSLRLESPGETLEQGRLDEREAGDVAAALEEARRALADAPPWRLESARRRVRRLERRLGSEEVP